MNTIRDEQTKELTAFITRRYLETGNDSTVKEMAEGLGWSASKVRAVIDHNRGALPGMCSQREARESFSKDYPSMQAGAHMVFVYGPTRATLRAMIVASERNPQ
ncbi:hypothetical protein Rctr197k_155 [Virus Rctr197k]|nr:hypothetical protein Rctr197k_155 [Virus Rctr197k]